MNGADHSTSVHLSITSLILHTDQCQLLGDVTKRSISHCPVTGRFTLFGFVLGHGKRLTYKDS